ncbi:GIY-YIG nuclease family protein [Morganella morganii]|uniref:GIY-YIG nuclease family protein n=1 Tax=Morganella morganii TaxID=582 RepID=UPI00298E2E4B|nr:GIY-YIG nuclease family protein [Morganella morganii]MDW7788765.1 GIY-YIG nuclease family protein [Morganella morganii]
MNDYWINEGSWIYVIMTGDNINRYKVGRTKNNPMLRVNQLRTGDPYLALQLAYFIPSSLTTKTSILEAAIHKQLESPISFYGEKKSEWFNGDARDVWNEIDFIFESLGCEVTDYYQPFESKVVRFWGGDLEDFYNWKPLEVDEEGFPNF